MDQKSNSPHFFIVCVKSMRIGNFKFGDCFSVCNCVCLRNLVLAFGEDLEFLEQNVAKGS